MARSRKEQMARMRNLGFKGSLKFCEDCDEPISIDLNWQYKYCLSCAKKRLNEFRRNNRSNFIGGGISSTRLEIAYANGRRWLKDKCEICSYSNILEAHRFISKLEGGTYTPENTVTLCPNCHSLITRKKAILERIENNNKFEYKLLTL